MTAALALERPSTSLWRRAAALFLASAALHLAGTWWLPLLDRDEPRFAEAAREMSQRGDWVVPWFNNQPRYDKPPLIYWLQIPAYRWFGETELSARLPSVLAAALTAVVVLGFGSRLLNPRAGLWAAIVFTTCLQTLVHAKLALADMLMILFFTGAAWCGWELSREPLPSKPAHRTAWWLGFTGSLALAFLAKGPIGWLPLLFPVLAPVLHRRPVPWRRLRLGTGAVLVVALVACWGVPALLRTHGEFWSVGMGKHVFQRSLNVLEGHGATHWFTYLATVPLYFVTVFGSFLPWSIWLPGLMARLWVRRRELTFDEKYLWLGVGLVFGVFSLVRTKLPHYTLPAFPLLALALVANWDRTTGIPVLAARRAAAAMAAFGLVISLVGFPLVAPLFPSRRLAQECHRWLTPDLEFASADYQEPSLCWYFRSRVRGFHQLLTLAELPAFMAKPGPRLCVLPTAKVPQIFPQPPPGWERIQIRGVNPAHGRRVELTALIKPGEAGSGEHGDRRSAPQLGR